MRKIFYLICVCFIISSCSYMHRPVNSNNAHAVYTKQGDNLVYVLIKDEKFTNYPINIYVNSPKDNQHYIGTISSKNYITFDPKKFLSEEGGNILRIYYEYGYNIGVKIIKIKSDDEYYVDLSASTNDGLINDFYSIMVLSDKVVSRQRQVSYKNSGLMSPAYINYISYKKNQEKEKEKEYLKTILNTEAQDPEYEADSNFIFKKP